MPSARSITQPSTWGRRTTPPPAPTPAPTSDELALQQAHKKVADTKAALENMNVHTTDTEVFQRAQQAFDDAKEELQTLRTSQAAAAESQSRDVRTAEASSVVINAGQFVKALHTASVAATAVYFNSIKETLRLPDLPLAGGSRRRKHKHKKSHKKKRRSKGHRSRRR